LILVSVANSMIESPAERRAFATARDLFRRTSRAESKSLRRPRESADPAPSARRIRVIGRHVVPFVLAALVGSAAAHAAPADTPYCEVAMEFSVDGKSVAAPSLVVRFGEPADVTIGDPAGHAWRFHVLADAPTIVHRANVIPVSVELDEIADGNAYRRASPHLGAVPGQRADLETIFGDGDGRKARITLVATPRSEAEVEAMKADATEPEPTSPR
jgi:hypothetical protein